MNLKAEFIKEKDNGLNYKKFQILCRAKLQTNLISKGQQYMCIYWRGGRESKHSKSGKYRKWSLFYSSNLLIGIKIFKINCWETVILKKQNREIQPKFKIQKLNNYYSIIKILKKIRIKLYAINWKILMKYKWQTPK